MKFKSEVYRVLSVVFLGFSMAILLPTNTLDGQSTLSPQSNGQGGRGVGHGQLRGEPCLKQAGISRSALQQRRQMIENARSQVEQICSNSSLSPQQKREQIQQLRASVRKQMASMLTPQQQQALAQCRQSHHTGMGRMHAGGHGGGNPCNALSRGAGASPAAGTAKP